MLITKKGEKMKVSKTKRALMMSMLSMVLSFVMLLGTTFAWFTDSVSSGVNRITAGNLDVGLEYASAGTYENGSVIPFADLT